MSQVTYKKNTVLAFLGIISQVILLFIGVYSCLMSTVFRLDIDLNRTPFVLSLLISSFVIWGLFNFLGEVPYGKFIATVMGMVLILVFIFRFRVVFLRGMIYTLNSLFKLEMTYYNMKMELLTYTPEMRGISIDYCSTVFFSVLGIILIFILSIGFYHNRNANFFMLVTLPFFLLPIFIGRVAYYNETIIYLISVVTVFGTRNSKKQKLDNNGKERISIILACIVILSAVITFTICPPRKYEKYQEDLFQIRNDVKVLATLTSEDIFDWIKANFSSEPMEYGLVGNRAKVTYNGKKIMEVSPSIVGKTPLYLKGYVGDKYREGKWAVNASAVEDTDSLSRLLAEEIAQYTDRSENYFSTESVIKIKNIALGRNAKVVPYFTTEKFTYNKNGRVEWDGGIEYSVRYYCMLQSRIESYLSGLSSLDFLNDENIKKDALKKIAYKYYLDIPKDYEKKVLHNFLKRFKRSNLVSQYINSIDNKQANVKALKKIIKNIQQYLSEENDYQYTLSPGKAPSGTDSMDYFLNTNKKGYCTHFATAATLMLRSLGIPARFVEGYYVSNDRLKKYVNQKEPCIKVLDEDAHAWVEVYIDGCGFVPVEFTPGISELNGGEGVPDDTNEQQTPDVSETTQTEPPWNIESPTPEEDMEFEDIESPTPEENTTKETSESIVSQIKRNGIRLLWIVVIVVISIPILVHSQWIIRQQIYYYVLKRQTKRGYILKMYFHIKPLLSSYHCMYEGETTEQYILKILKNISFNDENETRFIVRPYVQNLLKAEFGDVITSEELREYKKSSRMIGNKMMKQKSLVKRLIFRYIYNQ